MDLRFYSKSQRQRSKKDEKKNLTVYMTPSGSDKSSVFSNEERRLGDIEIGSVGGKESNKGSSKGKGKDKKRNSNNDGIRTSEL